MLPVFVRQEAAALSEAQASNQALRVQLVEATSAFHHALSIAQTLLTEGAPCKHFVQGFCHVLCFFLGVKTHALLHIHICSRVLPIGMLQDVATSAHVMCRLPPAQPRS